MKAGAVAGDTVVIGDLDGGVVFDWEPTLTTGPELLGSRGTDLRLEQNARPSRKERREVYHQVMDAKTAARDELWTEREAGHWTDGLGSVMSGVSTASPYRSSRSAHPRSPARMAVLT